MRMIVKSRRWLGEGARLKTDGDNGLAGIGKLRDKARWLDIGGGTIGLSKSSK
jgi:hypothetical protein